MLVKMRVTPTVIFFDDMSDDLLKAIPYPFEVRTAPKGYSVSGTPDKLYMLIVELSRTFDIEVY